MADPKAPVTPGGLIHRAPYDKATAGIMQNSMAGAMQGENDEMMLAELLVDWTVPINFDDQGTEYVNTAESGAQPAKVTARFVRRPPAVKGT